MDVAASKIETSASQFQSDSSTFELGMLIGVFGVGGFLVLGLLIKCVSIGKRASPAMSICNATLNLFLMLGISVMFCLTHFRLLYMLDYCEQVFEITYDNEIPAKGKGIGKHISCMPDEQTQFAAQLVYFLNTEYQKGLVICNDRLQDLSKSNPIVSSYTELRDLVSQSDALKLD